MVAVVLLRALVDATDHRVEQRAVGVERVERDPGRPARFERRREEELPTVGRPTDVLALPGVGVEVDRRRRAVVRDGHGRQVPVVLRGLRLTEG
ncbi:hypothetical protein [Cellulosimicrobium sp. NPDC057862]|uniref:hypothetical protein n=1 Tax=Cellulosimicrobium sp. NPDC057862 TaxID=3346266 RepID=UPI00366CE4F2